MHGLNVFILNYNIMSSSVVSCYMILYIKKFLYTYAVDMHPGLKYM